MGYVLPILPSNVSATDELKTCLDVEILSRIDPSLHCIPVAYHFHFIRIIRNCIIAITQEFQEVISPSYIDLRVVFVHCEQIFLLRFWWRCNLESMGKSTFVSHACLPISLP